ncbi:hypothetical protein TPR58_03685 [Sphingomonas sp. HF-S3]|uniref:Uncharacterized protein n=1 Tax=Sphingomonas rustica TaxID=3103142 RepID=A0ABV0B6E2_9SPHN
MIAREAIRVAKEYVADVFSEEGIHNIGLEEIEYIADGNLWMVTVGFSRDWDRPVIGGLLGDRAAPRTFKTVSIDNGSGLAIGIKNRIIQG